MSDVMFKEFVRKPFVVDAVEVTKENISEIAEFVGTLRWREDGTPFIAVNRDLVPNVNRVYLGYWVTRIGDNFRCYTKKIFNDQFTAGTPDMRKWIIQFDHLDREGIKESDYKLG